MQIGYLLRMDKNLHNKVKLLALYNKTTIKKLIEDLIDSNVKEFETKNPTVCNLFKVKQ